MKRGLILSILLMFPAFALADVALFTEVKLPDGSKAPLNSVIKHFIKVVNSNKEDLNQSRDFEIGQYFKEYHRALFKSNPDIQGELPNSIYQDLIPRFYSLAVGAGDDDYFSRFNFILYQAEKIGVDMKAEFSQMRDQLLLLGMTYRLRNEDVSAYNISNLIQLLDDKTKGFDLIVASLDFYQFNIQYAERPEEMGYRFSELFELLLRKYSLNLDREHKILSMALSINDSKIMPWYRKAKVDLNFPLYQSNSIFCYYTLVNLQRHLEMPEFFTKEQIFHGIKIFLSFGASFDALCSRGSLRDNLSELKTKYKTPLIEELLRLETEVLPISEMP
ncbi:MAG: hypothetical protein VX642_07230 [Bdellovibrionota bacterium]|nr:hypothetical protein [Bdellovibrionota bacterium]